MIPNTPSLFQQVTGPHLEHPRVDSNLARVLEGRRPSGGTGGMIPLPIRLGPPAMEVMKSRESKTFSYSVFREQASEGGYVAFVPALSGCHTQGETLEETEPATSRKQSRCIWRAWQPMGRRSPKRGHRSRAG